jgi:hypothetical protein
MATKDPHSAVGRIKPGSVDCASRGCSATGSDFHPLIGLKQDQANLSNAHMFGLQNSLFSFMMWDPD